MAAQEYYSSSPYSEQPAHRRLNAPLPPVPTFESPALKPKDPSTVAVSPISSAFDDDPGYTPLNGQNHNAGYFDHNPSTQNLQDPFGDHAAIPLQSHNPKNERYDPEDRRRHDKRKKRRFTKDSPWFIYCLTVIQIIVFIAEVIKNSILTGSPIETQPQFNPMIGPSPYVLINMGARYVSCMRNEAGVQNASTPVAWPCPNQTDTNPTCTLSDLCGFSGVPLPRINGSLDASPAPNQWFRFIVPIFLHAGLIHIGFNMLLQVLLGGDMERAIGPVRLALVYFSSGIFGFVLGGNFAPGGIASTGASGCIFGIIALTLLDLLYTWSHRKHPVRDLCFIILDVVISFVLGLLPGLDNFSHIGGFLMGLVLGVCLLRSPDKLRQRTGSLDSVSPHGVPGSGMPEFERRDPSRSAYANGSSSSDKRKTILSKPASMSALSSPKSFFSGRKALWWAWWLIRAAALLGVVAAFIALVKAFYQHHSTECEWCKYLSCLPISNWCDIGDLTFTKTSGS